MNFYRATAFTICLALLLGGGAVAYMAEVNHQPPPAPPPAAPDEVNRVEQAATPQAFAAISLSNNPGTTNLNLRGQILLGQGSDGLDPALDRLVIALGQSLTVLEPGSMRPAGQSNRVWTYQNPSHPHIRKVILQRQADESWQFEISSRSSMPENQRFHLRIGDDWGGINLGTGEMLLQMQPALNSAFQSQTMIGSAGGTVQTTDASGVVISLSIPAGALSEETLITVTPLESSPLVAPSGALHPGVKFEPEGLQFAVPATLTLDFSATARQVTNKDFIFLMTSPMTMVPLYGSADPANNTLTALVHHFSALQPGGGDPALSDLAAWVNTILSSGQNLTLAEIQSVIAAANTLLQQGCPQGCIDLGLMAQRVGESIKAIVTAECPDFTINPTDAAFNRLGQLEALSQQVGVSVPEVRTCMEQVLRGLIEKAALAGVANPSDATLQRVQDLWDRAALLAFPNLVTLARQKTEDVFRALIDRDGATAAADPSDANLRRLLDLKARAQLLSFPDRERQALEKVALAVRVIVARASAMCDSDEAAAQGEFQRAQTWHAAVSLDPTVDPTLAQTISDAIDDCAGGGNMTVTVEPSVSWVQTFSFSFKNDGPASTDNYFRIGCGIQQAFAQQDFLPISLEHQRCNATMKSALTQPRPNVLAWDVTMATSGNLPPGGIGEGGTSTAAAQYVVKLTFEEAGTLKLEVNPNWATRPSPNHLPSPVEVSVFGDSGFLGHINHRFYPLPPPWQGLSANETGTTAAINIAGPGTITLILRTSGLYDESGSGRMLTATFKPE
jgi:hypothetical protein